MKTTNAKHGQNMGRTCRGEQWTIEHVLSMFCTCSFHGNSINTLLSYCGLIDAKMRASDKDLPVVDICSLIISRPIIVSSNFFDSLRLSHKLYSITYVKNATDQMAVLIFETKQRKVSKMFVLWKYTAKFSIVNSTFRVTFTIYKLKIFGENQPFFYLYPEFLKIQ